MRLQIQDYGRSPCRLMDDAGNTVALVYMTDQLTRRRTPEALATAAQLSASGDLLEVCRYTRDVLSGATGEMFLDLIGRLDAAITKAETYNVNDPEARIISRLVKIV